MKFGFTTIYGTPVFSEKHEDTVEIEVHSSGKACIKVTLQDRLLGVSSPIIALAPEIVTLTLFSHRMGGGPFQILEVEYWAHPRPLDAIFWIQFDLWG